MELSQLSHQHLAQVFGERYSTRLRLALTDRDFTPNGVMRLSRARRSKLTYDASDYDMLLQLDENRVRKTLSQAQLSRLPTQTYRADARRAGAEELFCTICLDKPVDGECAAARLPALLLYRIATATAGDRLRTLPCLHRFHVKCIDRRVALAHAPLLTDRRRRWLHEKAVCPVCHLEVSI